MKPYPVIHRFSMIISMRWVQSYRISLLFGMSRARCYASPHRQIVGIVAMRKRLGQRKSNLEPVTICKRDSFPMMWGGVQITPVWCSGPIYPGQVR
jgi:hypothetical protein